LRRIQEFFAPRPRQLAAAKVEAQMETLAEDLQDALRALGHDKGAVLDTAQRAVSDYSDLRDVLMGPGASSDAAEDVTLLAEAEDVLRSMLTRAPHVKTLAAIAARRSTDKQGREAAGEALLKLRDQGRALQELTSASLLWASSKSRAHHEQMHACAERMRTSAGD